MSGRKSAWRTAGAVSITATLSIVLSILYVFLTPPFQTPDEPAHYIRAIALARGEIAAVKGPAGGGSWIPGENAQLIREWIYLRPGGRQSEQYDEGHFRRSKEIRPGQHAVFVPGAGGRLPSRINTNANSYLPVAHAVPAATELACRWAGLPVLHTFFLMRLSNALAGTMLVVLAVAVSPSFRWSLGLISLFPMAVSLRASLSPDAIVFPLALLVIALVWRMSSDGFSSGRLAGFLIASSVMTAIKLPYFVIPLAFLLIPRSRFPSIATRVASCILTVVIVGASCFAALAFLRVGEPPPPSGVAVRGGSVAALSDPGELARRMITTLTGNGAEYASEIVGKLGWLNVPLPLGTAPAVLVVLVVVSILAPGAGIEARLRWGGVLTACAAITLVCVSLYAYAPVGRPGIDGLQGRYFLPIIPLLLSPLGISAFVKLGGERAAGIMMTATSLIANGLALFVLMRAFY